MSDFYYLRRVSDGAWWRPEGKGYTDNKSEAGTFEEEYAKLVELGCHGEHQAILVGSPNPFTPYEQAILHLAHFDCLYHGIKSAAQDVLKSRRAIGSSGNQEAVLSDALDKLAEEVAKAKPKWGEIK